MMACTRRRWVALAAWLLTSLVQVGCRDEDCHVEPVESGEYIIGKAVSVSESDDEAWLAESLVGGQLVIDREARVATLRYTRGETTYEVSFTIARQ